MLFIPGYRFDLCALSASTVCDSLIRVNAFLFEVKR